MDKRNNKIVVNDSNVHYLTDSNFISLSNNMTLVSVPNLTFNTMLKMSGGVNDDGIITDKKKFHSFLNVLESQKQRPPKTNRSNINYSEELQNVINEVKILITDVKTGKRRKFLQDDGTELHLNYNVRSEKKLKQQSKERKDKITS